jgi:hypothetical protein
MKAYFGKTAPKKKPRPKEMMSAVKKK